MSDLQIQLEQRHCDPISISSNNPCGCLIWADDLLILSKSEEGLQNMLNSLNEFSTDNGLKPNMEKTKIMIFNKTGRHLRKRFTLGGKVVSTTREYKYLGFVLTPSGEINSGLIDLKDRALRAFMKLKKKLGSNFRTYPLITIKLFETLIKPILLYSSDFWGILKLPKNNPLDTLYLSFCKQLLGVQKQTTNVGVLLELGMVPLHLYAKKNAIKNWNRIAKLKQANRLMALSYTNSISEQLSWPTQCELNLSQIGMMEVWINNNTDINLHKKFFRRLNDIFNQNSFSEINKPESKLRTYKRLKTEIGFENYLSSIISQKDRISLTKLRLSNHKLMIEKGRHDNIPKEGRFCPFCKNKVEDEVHFLMQCATFKTFTKPLFAKHLKNPIFGGLDETGQFTYLLKDIDNISEVAHSINKMFHCRDYLLEEHKNHQ